MTRLSILENHRSDAFRDNRNGAKPVHTYTESHTDTITALSFSPSRSHSGYLLSGSTDGLCTIFNVSEPDEDDAVLQVFNHRGAIHKARWAGGSNGVWASSSDERLGFYEFSPTTEGKEEEFNTNLRDQQDLGDVRDQTGCRYLVDIHTSSEQPDSRIFVGDST
jgi:WD repeat-containing protein 89